MQNIDELKQQELVQLQNEEMNLEELIILGDDKKIPIIIEFPKTDGTTVKAKALVKQLTLKEFDNIKLNNPNQLELSVLILKKALFKQNEDYFTTEEIKTMPIGVIRAIADKVMEISGITEETNQQLIDF